jgi:hypothetical protein
VPLSIGCQGVDQLMALVLPALTIAAWPRSAVRLVHDHEIRCSTQEGAPVPLRLDEVDARDEVRVVLVYREVLPGQLALEAGDARWAYHRGVDRELLA